MAAARRRDGRIVSDTEIRDATGLGGGETISSLSFISDKRSCHSSGGAPFCDARMPGLQVVALLGCSRNPQPKKTNQRRRHRNRAHNLAGCEVAVLLTAVSPVARSRSVRKKKKDQKTGSTHHQDGLSGSSTEKRSKASHSGPVMMRPSARVSPPATSAATGDSALLLIFFYYYFCSPWQLVKLSHKKKNLL